MRFWRKKHEVLGLKRGLSKRVRKVIGGSLIGIGMVGIIVPVLPALPAIIAGLAVLGPDSRATRWVVKRLPKLSRWTKRHLRAHGS